MSKGFNYKNLITAIERHENHKFSSRDLYWCSDCVVWLWRWRKISKEQMEDAADRITQLFNERC